MLEIRLFGSPQVIVDGKPQSKIPTRKSVLLLARLALNSSKPQDRNVLAFDLWPDVPESRARRNLNTEVWRLKQVLGEKIVADSKSIQLIPDATFFVDVQAFESVAVDAPIAEFENAIANYHGDFLAGYYEDWVLLKRESYQNCLMQYLDQCARHYQANSLPRKAIEFVRKILFYNPLHEESHQRLMRLFIQTGDYVSAIQQYRQCAELLERELGLKPMPETETLFQRIMNESRDGSGQLSPSVQPEKVFVGRNDPLRELDAKRKEVLHGRTQSVIITGESGIGKTRLVEHWLDGVSHSGIILRGRCYEVDQRVPFRPITEMFRSAVQEYGDDELNRLSPPVRNEIRKVMPEVRPASLNTKYVELPPAQAQERLVNSLALGLSAWSSQGKLTVIFIDDMQWADKETMDVTEALLARGDDSPLLLIATYRPDPLTVVEDRNARFANLESTTLALDQLSQDEVAEMIRNMGNLPDAPQEFAGRIYAETEGNPLFIVESLRDLFDSGYLSTNSDGIWSVSLDRPVSGLPRLPLSANLRQTILKRVERLNADQRAILALAAVIGKGFDVGILRSITGLTDTAIQDALMGLLRYGLIRETSTTSFDFSHVKIMETLLSAMTDPSRRALHLQVAGYIERRELDNSNQRFEQLAYHFQLSGDEVRALDYFVRAGEQAMEIHAYKAAVMNFETALPLCATEGGAEIRFRILMKLYICLWATSHDLFQMEKALEESQQVAEEIEDAELLTRFYFYRGVNQVSMGKWVEARIWLEKSLEHASGRFPKIEMSVHLEICNLLKYTHEASKAQTHWQKALALARAVNDVRAEERAHWEMSDSDMNVFSQSQLGLEIAERALATNTPELLLDLGSSIVISLLRAGNPGAALQQAERFLALGREQGIHAFQKTVQRSLAYVLLEIGQYESALQMAKNALTASRLTGYRYGEMRALTCMGMGDAGLGHFDDALKELTQAADLAGQMDSKSDLAFIRVQIAETLILVSHPSSLSAAEAMALQVLTEQHDAILQASFIFALNHLARIRLVQGRVDEAFHYSGQAVNLMQSPVNRDLSPDPRVYFTRFTVLRSVADEIAPIMLRRARDILYQCVMTLPPRFRRDYLNRVRVHREIAKTRRTSL